MKNTIKLIGTQSLRFYAIALLAVIGFSFAACGNGTTNGGASGIDDIIRIDKEVRELIFYDTTGDSQIDFSGDIGTVGGVCSDYAAEFYYRYPGEVYLVAMTDSGLTTWCTAEWLPAGTYNWRTRGNNFGMNTMYHSLDVGGTGEYDGVLRDARVTIVSAERWKESTHANAFFHMWCVAVADGKWYLVDPTWRDTSNPDYTPIKEITPPVNINRKR